MFFNKFLSYMIIVFSISLLGCSGNNSSTDTKLKITFHDSLVGTEEMSSINMNLLRTEIISVDGDKTVISDEAMSFNLLELTSNNPVTLAHTNVSPRMYSQIRLILDESSSITFTDGRTEPLKVPSGEQTGIKIDGVFDLPSGQFYTLDIDLIPGESIHYTEGNGYMMKPVIELTGSHINSGSFYYGGEYGGYPFTIKLNTDGSMNALYGGKPKYNFSGTYDYNSIEQTLTVKATKARCPSCSWLKRRAVERADMPAPFVYNVSTFTEDRIVLTDEEANSINLFKTDDFALTSTSLPNEFFTINIDLNNTLYANKTLLLRFFTEETTSLTGEGYFALASIDENAMASVELELSGYEFGGGEVLFEIGAAIINSDEDVIFDAEGISSIENVIATNFADMSSIAISLDLRAQIVDVNMTDVNIQN